MITIFSPDHTLHDAPHEFLDGKLIPPHESPMRTSMILDALERAGIGPIQPPRAFDLSPIRAVHADDYLDYLANAYEAWIAAGGDAAAVLPSTLAVRWMSRRSVGPLVAPGYYSFDLSAPIVAGTYRAARAAADVALTGAARLLEGQALVYALCRPPGHHAGRDLYGGYCYLNNAAIAAQYLGVGSWDLGDGDEAQLPTPTSQLPHRVAVLDIDFHHGNGTQQIFYERDDVLFVSIHADPAREYPYFAGYADERGAGAGAGFNLNFALEAGVTNARYLDVLEQALAAIAAFAPRFLVLSAGFDTFGGDPIGDFALTADAYPLIGRQIAALGMPTLIVQEGGYAVSALGENVVGLLRGLSGM
ncbi:MAG TPA: histone deacetylase family protein [Roseiflexaceae bacterium]|nr:histone deacetylase family protein [Roseiflexaceae bacterium]